MYVCILGVLFCVYVTLFLCLNFVKISKIRGDFSGLKRSFFVRGEHFFGPCVLCVYELMRIFDFEFFLSAGH